MKLKIENTVIEKGEVKTVDLKDVSWENIEVQMREIAKLNGNLTPMQVCVELMRGGNVHTEFKKYSLV